jgi:thiol-disulfide isomerase/thioredoxin
VLIAGRRGVFASMGALVAGGTLGAGPLSRPARAQAVGTLREDGPKPLPAVTLTDPDGTPQAMPFFAGKGIVLNLWATWCPPCVEEMPALDRLAALLAAEDILVIPASSDRNGRAQVAPFFARTGVKNLGIWLDPGSAATRALGARGLPTTILIDRRGRERGRLEGAAAWDGGTLLADVRRLCGDGRPERPVTEPT